MNDRGELERILANGAQLPLSEHGKPRPRCIAKLDLNRQHAHRFKRAHLCLSDPAETDIQRAILS